VITAPEAGAKVSMRDLTAQAVGGQPAAIESLLGQVRPMVLRYCRARLGRMAGHSQAADDVAQEVCIALLSALPRYRDMGRPFASFVFGIASHKVADAVRTASRLAVPFEDLPDGPDERPGPEETVVAYIEAERTRALLAQLPHRLALAPCLPSRATPTRNPHSARCTIGAPHPATSCLGAFRTPAYTARGWARHCRHPKCFTTGDSCIATAERRHGREHQPAKPADRRHSFSETMRLYIASPRWPSSNCAVFKLIQLRLRPRPQRLEDLSGRMSSTRSSGPSPRVLPGCRFA